MTDSELVEQLVRLKAEAFRLGLFRTAHAIDDATTVVGWEIAAQLEKGDKK